MNPGIDFHACHLRAGRAVRSGAFLLALLTVLTAAALAVQTGTSPAVAQTSLPTEISGHVVNGTPGGTVPAGMNVVLLVVDEQQQSIIARDQKVVGTNGEFAFTDLLSGPNLTYRVVADNGDHTPSVDLVPGRDAFENVELKIWDSTGSFDDIRVSMYSIFIPAIDPANRLMGVLAVAEVVNSGDHVWIPDLSNPNLTGLDLLRFNLPEGYQGLAVESTLPTGSILEIPTGFALTTPIPPGEAQVLMTYAIEYTGSSLAYPLRLPYGADLVRIGIPEGSGSVSGLGLGNPEGVVVDDRAYSVVQGTGYARDAQLDVRFESLPTPNAVENLRNFFKGRGYIIVIAWVVGAALLGLLAYAFFYARQRREVSEASQVETDPEASPLAVFPEYAEMDRAQAVQAIADLEERHEAGEIEEEDFKARRSALTQAALVAAGTDSGE